VLSEGGAGQGLMGSGGVISLIGVCATVGVPVAVVGGGLATHSVFVFKRSAQNLINCSGQVKAAPVSNTTQPKYESINIPQENKIP